MGCGVQDDGFVIVNIDAADQIDHVDKRIEIDLHIIINRNANKMRDSLHGQCRTTARKLRASAQTPGRIDPAVAKARDVHPHIARDGKHPGRVRGGVDGQQDQGIRAEWTIPIRGISSA